MMAGEIAIAVVAQMLQIRDLTSSYTCSEETAR